MKGIEKAVEGQGKGIEKTVEGQDKAVGRR